MLISATISERKTKAEHSRQHNALHGADRTGWVHNQKRLDTLHKPIKDLKKNLLPTELPINFRKKTNNYGTLTVTQSHWQLESYPSIMSKSYAKARLQELIDTKKIIANQKDPLLITLLIATAGAFAASMQTSNSSFKILIPEYTSQ